MARKKRVGVVVSNKPQKTIVVAIQIRYQHPKYVKTLIKTTERNNDVFMQDPHLKNAVFKKKVKLSKYY